MVVKMSYGNNFHTKERFVFMTFCGNETTPAYTVRLRHKTVLLLRSETNMHNFIADFRSLCI